MEVEEVDEEEDVEEEEFNNLSFIIWNRNIK